MDCRIDPSAIIKRPELAQMGNHISIHLGVYISTAIELADYVEIGPYVCIIGGAGGMLRMGRCTFLSAGARVVCVSDDFRNSLAGAEIPVQFRSQKTGVITLEDFCGAGINSIIMPGVTMREGAVLGAGSLLLKDAEPWGIYVGSPARKIGERNKVKILENANSLFSMQ